MMNAKRLTASVTMAALVLGVAAAPVLADRKGENDQKGQSRISEQYGDMGQFEWGLNDVTKMSVKGIFKGRGEGLFAPGAKITHQESAVALVRLMDKESEALELTAAEVKAQLAGIPDAAEIAVWARPAVAALVKAGVVEKDAAFAPEKDATRLDIAVLLVKAIGLEAEAEAKADTKLSFKDAQLIPSEYIGYVAVAVDHKLITGYEDKTFRPNQAVKRVEMAVMMGRADRLVEREKQDEYKGTVKAVNATAGTFVIRAGDRDLTLTLADDASIFIDNAEKALADLKAGMRVEVKLNASGAVIFVEAKSPETSPNETTISGKITDLVPAVSNALALVSIDGTAYPVSPRAQLKIDGQAATFADLQEGDTVKAYAMFGLILKLEVQREAQVRTGTISDLKVASTSSRPKITLTYPSVTTPAPTEEFTLAANAVIKLNGATAQFSALREGDSAKLTLNANGEVAKVEAQRAAETVTGSIEGLTAATSTSTAKIKVLAEGESTATVYSLTATAVIKLNGQTARFADLKVGDAVTLTVNAGKVEKIEATRSNATVIEGSITSLTAAAVGSTYLGKISVGYTVNGSFTLATYNIPSNASILLNGEAAEFVDLHLNDAVKVTLVSNVLTKVEVTR
ncbi:MAG TPA: S-layer homology domain-containing protein [Symbiobacteriaceae bacterium]|nr:S-layer homology domain-containing protein [Symbiobacteriaceae bacterium]